MQPAKRPKFPLILVAHDLRDGEVVFIGAQHWSFDRADALVVHDDISAEAVEAIGRAGIVGNQLVDLEWVGVAEAAEYSGTDHSAQQCEPRDVRERYKLRGPSVRPDLGKQAEHRRLREGAA